MKTSVSKRQPTMESEARPIVHLMEKLQIEEVLYENPIFSVDPHDLNETGKEEHTNIRDLYSIEKLEPYLKPELRRVNAFEKIRKRMTALTPDGMVMKELVQEGYNDVPNYGADGKQYIVEYYYAAYAENNDLPFDIVMPRLGGRFQKPRRIKIGTQSIIPGLEIAVKSMCRAEIANFLIHPHLAYRDGQPPRIPKQATILFVVELLDIKIDNSNEDDGEDRYWCSSFKETLKKVTEICESGKQLKSKGDNHKAIRKYRKAEAVLASAHFANEQEEKIGNEKYMVVYTNLAVCHSDVQEYRKVCTAFNNAKYRDHRLANRNIKLLYHSARALRMLGDYKEAKSRIATALKISPKNRDLLEEQKNINQSAVESRQEEVQRYKKMLSMDEERTDEEVIEFMNDIKEFLEELRRILEEFKEDPESAHEFDISLFSSAELECFEAECRRQQVRIRKQDSTITLLADSL